MTYFESLLSNMSKNSFTLTKLSGRPMLKLCSENMCLKRMALLLMCEIGMLLLSSILPLPVVTNNLAEQTFSRHFGIMIAFTLLCLQDFLLKVTRQWIYIPLAWKSLSLPIWLVAFHHGSPYPRDNNEDRWYTLFNIYINIFLFCDQDTHIPFGSKSSRHAISSIGLDSSSLAQRAKYGSRAIYMCCKSLNTRWCSDRRCLTSDVVSRNGSFAGQSFKGQMDRMVVW